jgi:hypothetical protein
MPALVSQGTRDDLDKLMYIRSGRWLVRRSVCSSFVPFLSAGMVLFIKASVAFYWFAMRSFVFFAAYMTMSYVAVGLRRKDFDYVKHQAQLRKVRRLQTGRRHLLCQYVRGSHTHQQHLDSVADLDWLRERVHAYVLDDGQPGCTRHGTDLVSLHRPDDRPHLKKAW